MNEILRDLVNKDKVTVFVNNVLVGTETEEGHDEIVEKVLRRLEENDLYVKPEKCIESKEDWVPQGHHRTQWDRNRKGKYTTREVLSIKCSDKLWRLVAFTSKFLSDTERNYEIHNKEMLAVVKYLEVQRYFLEGTTIKFEIWTDHKNLKYFMKVQKLNRRQAKWVLYLSRFDFMLKHIPESRMGKVDSLSRRLDQEVEVERDNEDKTLVKPKWLKVRKTKKVEVIIEEVDLLEKVRQ